MFSACSAATTPRLSMILEPEIVPATLSSAEQTAIRTMLVPWISFVCSSALYHVDPTLSWTLSIAASH